MLESSNRHRPVPTADDAVEKNRLECALMETVEGNKAAASRDASAAGRSWPLALVDIAAEVTEGESSSSLGVEQKEAGTQLLRLLASPRHLHYLHRYQTRDGNEQYKLMKSKPFKGNKLFRQKTFSVDGLSVQRSKNCDCIGCLLLSHE